MIKLIFCLRRLPHLSREQFQAYWLDRHGPLVRQHAAALRIRRYVQSHGIAEDLAERFRRGRGGPEAFDGVAELWYASEEDLQAGRHDPAAREAGRILYEDERSFIDLARSPLSIVREQTIIPA